MKFFKFSLLFLATNWILINIHSTALKHASIFKNLTALTYVDALNSIASMYTRKFLNSRTYLRKKPTSFKKDQKHNSRWKIQKALHRKP